MMAIEMFLNNFNNKVTNLIKIKVQKIEKG